MEPFTLLATAGAVANIVAILGRSLVVVAELRSEWTDTDLTILSFETQLATLRTALTKVMEWVENHYAEDPHHQLVMDLDRCVACCRLLISKVDADIQPFQRTATPMDGRKKFKMLLKTKDFRKTQRMIEQQTNALTLLLTACNTTMLSQQQEFLEKPQARRIFNKMEDDTASMFVHLDADSLVTSPYTTAPTIRSSKRSLKFDFDKHLLVSRIYEKWIRGSVKKALRDQQPQKETAFELDASGPGEPACLGVVSETGTYSATSSGPDPYDGSNTVSELQSPYNTMSELQSPYNTVSDFQSPYPANRAELESPYLGTTSSDPRLFDSPSSSFSAAHPDAQLITSMITPPPPYSPGERWKKFPSIRKSDARKKSIAIDNSIKEQAKESKCDYEALLIGSDSKIEVFNSIRAKHTPRGYAERASQDSASTGIHEARLQMGNNSIHLLSIGGVLGERKKWMHHFESAAFIIFVMDLDSYDEGSKMIETLRLFEDMVTSKLFIKASVILLLNKATSFKEKLQWKPLSDCFPEYNGGSDYHKAAEYILWRFNMLNKGRLIMYPCMTESSDPSGLDSMSTIIKEAVINYALRDAKILV